MTNSRSLPKHTSGTVFGLWLLSTTAAAISTAAGFYWLGQIDGIPVASISLILLGIPQGIIMQRYGQRTRWWKWFLLTAVGWLIVIPLAVVVDFLAEVGGGLNPETDVRGQCLLPAVVVLGFIFGTIQNARSSDPLGWGAIHAVAVTVGALIGGLVGFWVYPEEKLRLAYTVLTDSERAAGIAAGFLVGMIVYGLIIGFPVAWSLRYTAIVQKGLAENGGTDTPNQ